MKKFYKNIIFILLLLICLLCIFYINYHFDIYKLRNANPYDYNFNSDRKLVNIKLKTGKNYNYDKILIGSSSTWALFEDIYSKNEICRIILMPITYKEYYEILQTFLELHPEVKTLFFPLDFHILLFNQDYYDSIPNYDYKQNLSVKEFIYVYFSFKTTFESLKSLQKIFEKQPEAYPPAPGTIVVFPKYRLSMHTQNILSERKRQEDIYYIEKIIDLLQEKETEIICFIPPVNYIYIQEALTSEKVKVLEDVKRLVTSKGVKIYDFTKKNKYNTQRLDETFLFIDIVHTNNLYGNIVYKNLTKQKDDKGVYRLITKENLEECNKLTLKELEEYKKTNKEYIDEYYTFPDSEDWFNPAIRKVILKKDIPKEIIEY